MILKCIWTRRFLKISNESDVSNKGFKIMLGNEPCIHPVWEIISEWYRCENANAGLGNPENLDNLIQREDTKNNLNISPQTNLSGRRAMSGDRFGSPI